MTRCTAFAPILLAAALLACGGEKEKPAAATTAPAAAPAAKPAPTSSSLVVPTTTPTPDSLPRGLMLALSQFAVSPEGKVLPQPGAAKLEILVRQGGAWKVSTLEDPESNVFHKAMVYAAPDGPAILTLGGTKAALKLWRKGAKGFESVATLWTKDFGGKFSRMRDAEIAAAFGAGRNGLAVATHDQGMVDRMRRRVIELRDGHIVRDEYAAGYTAEFTAVDLPPQADEHFDAPLANGAEGQS